MDLRHYARKKFELDREFTYSEDRGIGKPPGFWVSVLGEDDWPTFATDNDYLSERFSYEYEVVLKGDANVLMIDNEVALRTFSRGLPMSRNMPNYGSDMLRDWVPTM